MAKILVVDDEPSIREALSMLLAQNGHEALCVEDGPKALDLLDSECPQMVLLDIMLPGMDGYEVCEKMRERGCKAPIIFLSAKGDIVDKKMSFRVGGDDHLSKPFDPAELILRIESLLRRQTVGLSSELITCGDLEIDSDMRRVLKSGEAMRLSSKEFQLLLYLAQRRGRILSNAQILQGVWGGDYAADIGVVAVYVRRLREKLEDDPSHPVHILTEWGTGYRFV